MRESQKPPAVFIYSIYFQWHWSCQLSTIYKSSFSLLSLLLIDASSLAVTLLATLKHHSGMAFLALRQAARAKSWTKHLMDFSHMLTQYYNNILYIHTICFMHHKIHVYIVFHTYYFHNLYTVHTHIITHIYIYINIHTAIYSSITYNILWNLATLQTCCEIWNPPGGSLASGPWSLVSPMFQEQTCVEYRFSLVMVCSCLLCALHCIRRSDVMKWNEPRSRINY